MAENAASYVQLHEHLEHLRQVVTINEDVTKEVMHKFENRVQANIAAQRDPYGNLWRPSKWGAVLKNAFKAISFTASGSTIKMEVSGVEALHHVGSAKGYHGGSAKQGGYRRALIPFSKLPGPFKDDIREVLQKRFNQIFHGRWAA